MSHWAVARLRMLEGSRGGSGTLNPKPMLLGLRFGGLRFGLCRVGLWVGLRFGLCGVWLCGWVGLGLGLCGCWLGLRFCCAFCLCNSLPPWLSRRLQDWFWRFGLGIRGSPCSSCSSSSSPSTTSSSCGFDRFLMSVGTTDLCKRMVCKNVLYD